MKSLLLRCGSVSVLLVLACIQWGFTAEEQGTLADLVDIRGHVNTEEGEPVRNFPVRCKASQQPTNGQEIVREVLTDQAGKFTLARLPSHIGTINCEVGDGRIYVKSLKTIPVGRDTEVALTVDFMTVNGLQGWISVPKGWKLENGLIQITRNGTTVTKRADDKGEVVFESLKAGPATVTYSAEGVQPKEVPDTLIVEGTQLSASLPFDGFPFCLVLLLPAIIVLIIRATQEKWWKQCDKDHSCDASLSLICITLAAWGITFFGLWLALSYKTNYSLHYFHPVLSFSLAVPVFGFLGALLFVIDVFLKGRQDAGTHMEFVMRLVLGPYVAIVMVVLFSNAFTFVQVAEKLELQAMLAFFSGFLVVLVLQNLAEKGNEILGQWRNASRYKQTEIAQQLDLGVEEDLKLQKVNLKYLDQLRMLSRQDLEQMAKQGELSEAFLLGLRNQALVQGDWWKTLAGDGIKTIWDLAPLTPPGVQALSQKHGIDPALLTKYADEAKKQLGIP